MKINCKDAETLVSEENLNIVIAIEMAMMYAKPPNEEK